VAASQPFLQARALVFLAIRSIIGVARFGLVPGNVAWSLSPRI
jgi:hypothetical protein